MPVATFPDLTHQARTWHREPMFSTITQTSASGKEVRLGLFAANRLKYELEISLLDATTYATLRDFYVAQNGPLIAFNYVEPAAPVGDGTTKLVRFTEDSFDFSTSSYAQFRVAHVEFITTDT